MGLDLNPADWAVLGVVAEQPTHGFAVSQVLDRNGPVGRVWTVPRPIVYQVLKKLDDRGLVAGRKTEPGARGPVRTVFGVTPRGRRALATWLAEPVEHVRDVRSLLLLKLALLDRAGRDPRTLVSAQEARVLEQVRALEAARGAAEGFDRVILVWRVAGT